MGKEDVAQIDNGILLSHEKNEIISFTAKRIDLEVIILNEDKDKYHVISLFCGIY